MAYRTQANRLLGIASFAEYSERVLGHTPRVTEERLRAARTLQDLPALAEALETGTLCWTGAAARLQSELDSIVASGSLGDVDVEVACASNLCRALLTASDVDTANQGAETLSARIAKNFGAMTVLHTGDAERSIFVGKTSDDIAPEPRQPV